MITNNVLWSFPHLLAGICETPAYENSASYAMWVPTVTIFRELHNFIPINHPTETLWATGLLTQTKVSFLLAGLRLRCATQYHSDYARCSTWYEKILRNLGITVICFWNKLRTIHRTQNSRNNQMSKKKKNPTQKCLTNYFKHLCHKNLTLHQTPEQSLFFFLAFQGTALNTVLLRKEKGNICGPKTENLIIHM